MTLLRLALAVPLVAAALAPAADPPPGRLPVNVLDGKTPWADVRATTDKAHLYLPPGDRPVKGVFFCTVFHSGDPRELARLWDYALVVAPWEMLWDVGLPDKRSPRAKGGAPLGDAGVFLRYLDEAAKQTKRPELATAPLVGWLNQGGSGEVADDLFARAPDRVLAWSGAHPTKFLKRQGGLVAKLPFAIAGDPGDEKARTAERAAKLPALKDKPAPPPDFYCRGTSYGFGHGIYSKWNFYMAFLDRCVRARTAGKDGKLPLDITTGWAADFNEVGEWAAIAPANDAKGMVDPVWLPDEYAAWTFRAFHTADPDVKLAAPVIAYKPGGGPECGLGYGNPAKSGAPLSFRAEATGAYAQVEFRDGNVLLGTAGKAPWELDGVKLGRGLHALFPVGARADGTRAAGRPALLVAG